MFYNMVSEPGLASTLNDIFRCIFLRKFNFLVYFFLYSFPLLSFLFDFPLISREKKNCFSSFLS
ncbi:hypothetical protein MtrunA17_Chr1g0189741 [Medicago truncatula]|uniref:Transmembrane protein n=1 Tax=Medicago truncatula TaxID=3880 RepID=A0A396JW54_MEDTR|nr:hypothetical protein MtrunA17_Chr1g0189741 [Medicago truncatula]